jgi:signal transduction histidine kinase
MNLLVNAAQAIDTQGTITVRTQSGGEGWVKIDIIDTGKGIAKDNIHRVFEPFYTTKPVGKGTGLGLSLSYGIIASHHGRIGVESEVGKGTTFTILLPVAQPQFKASSSTEVE